MLDNFKLELYWQDIPTEKENALCYTALREMWSVGERKVRHILQALGAYDNGDNYILVRSGRNKGFYKTDDCKTIELYRQECINKGRSILAPVRKMNRVLNTESEQYSMINNMRLFREHARYKQSEVVEIMRKQDPAFDASLLSKMENNVCLPTYGQLLKLSSIYGCRPDEILRNDLY